MFDPDNTDYLAEAAQNGLTRVDGFPQAYFPDSVEDQGDSDHFSSASAEWEAAGRPDDFEFFKFDSE